MVRKTALERICAIGRGRPGITSHGSVAGHDNLYYTGTPGARCNPAVGLGIPDLTALAGFLG